MASNILATRLRKLVAHSIIKKSPIKADARRNHYALTDKGLALSPVVMAVMAWGDAWSPGDAGPLVQLVHGQCGLATQPGVTCSACGGTLGPAGLRANISAAYGVNRPSTGLAPD